MPIDLTKIRAIDIGTSKTIALQQVMNPAQPQPIPLRCPLVLF